MSRSVVLAGTERCERCLLPPRWCVCGALEPVISPLRVGILMHRRELGRPTSTGRLIERAVVGARRHRFRGEDAEQRAEVLEPGRQLWILHPRGEPLSAVAPTAPPAGELQVLLLDGSWGESAKMLRAVEHWGRPVSLPLAGASRYWLREQSGPGQLSTVEALIGLHRALGLDEAAERLGLHFELQVFAGLNSRGRSPAAATYLEGSPIRQAIPEFLDRLRQRRPNLAALRDEQALAAARSGVPGPF